MLPRLASQTQLLVNEEVLQSATQFGLLSSIKLFSRLRDRERCFIFLTATALAPMTAGHHEIHHTKREELGTYLKLV